MITALEIDNFKCFGSLSLPLHKLTLLTGFNGGGKSTAIQPLLLLAQTMRSDVGQEAYALNGSLVQLGTIGDILSPERSKSTITFQIISEGQRIVWEFATRAGDRYLRLGHGGIAYAAASPPSSDQVSAQLRAVQALVSLSFVSAVRRPPADAYPSPEIDNERLNDVGADGRYAAYWYERAADDSVDEARRHPGEEASSLRKQVDAWFSSLFPGAQANVQAFPHLSLVGLQFRATETGEWRRPANVGYGFTYAFPIIVALLTAERGSVIVIDSPEAHLHPYAQSQMGRALAHFASAGIQVLVETHSDHLLNGARLAIKDGAISSTDVAIHFFTGASEASHGVITPVVDANGHIDEWPAGFFDQSEMDLSRLSGWNS